MADDLREMIDIARRDMPEVPAETWQRLERIIRLNFGAQRTYIAAQKKGRHLATLEACGEQDANKIADMLGVTVQHARRLKKLR